MTDKLTILIVDDEQDFRNLTKELLDSDEYHFVSANSGEEAIQQLKNLHPALIMLDVLMPGIDGFETCERIRSDEITRHIPLLMMTSMNDDASIEKAYKAGATDFIRKPFSATQLRHKIKFLLKSQADADELRATKQKLETAQRIAKLGHWEWDLASNKVTWSEGISNALGYSKNETSDLSQQLSARIHPEDKRRVKRILKKAIEDHTPYSLEHRIVLPDGKINTLIQEGEVFLDANGSAYKLVGTIQDITSRKKTEDKVKTLSYFNKVTGLPNRASLKRRLGKYIAASTGNNAIAVLTLSLDRFKLITDSYGHAFGENLIRNISIRLIRSINESAYFTRDNNSLFPKKASKKSLTISHCDADEFVIALPQLTDIDDAAMIARNITRALAEQFKISGQEIRVTASIGISVFPYDGKDTDTVLKNSATALYHAKRKGGDGYTFFTTTMNARAFERLTMETSLRKAVDNNEFELYFQPKMAISSKQLMGMEALLRWNHPELGLVPPDEFMNILEKTGLIIPLGETIIQSACEKISAWDRAGYKPIPVAINLSPVQLSQKDFHLRLSRIINKTKINPNLLELEITESTLMNNMSKSITMLKKLRLLGVEIALDDFGTGYSSLTYLKHFPVSTLKIDRSFIQHVAADPDDAAIVKGVIGLAHNMQLKVVAEGVEEKAQLAYLEEIGCDYAQGYYYSKPVDVAVFTELFMEKYDQASSLMDTLE